MKILVVCVLGCAVIVLAQATGATAENNQTVISSLAKRTFYHCYHGWFPISGRLFRFISTPRTWVAAERYCQAIGGNLASVRNFVEYHRIQRMIRATGHCLSPAWIGGSDAQQEGYWFWSDGSRFRYTYWCRGEPNNHWGQQHCLQINFSRAKCWDDYQCKTSLPFVCAKKRW